MFLSLLFLVSQLHETNNEANTRATVQRHLTPLGQEVQACLQPSALCSQERQSGPSITRSTGKYLLTIINKNTQLQLNNDHYEHMPHYYVCAHHLRYDESHCSATFLSLNIRKLAAFVSLWSYKICIELTLGTNSSHLQRKQDFKILNNLYFHFR